MKIPNKSFFIIIILVAVIIFSVAHKTLQTSKEGFNIIRNPITDIKKISGFLSGNTDETNDNNTTNKSEEDSDSDTDSEEEDEHDEVNTQESFNEYNDFKEYQTFKNYEKFKQMMGKENMTKRKKGKEGFDNIGKLNIISKQQLFGF